MTVPGVNPYGDQAGNPQDWQGQQNVIQTAYDNSLLKLQAQREGTLQQYGFTSQGGLNDILGGKQANVSFNPEYQNSIYGNAMKQHGNTLQSLREKTIQRGLGDYGLGQQDENAYQGIAAGENEGIKTNLMNSLTGNIGEAQSAQTQLNQGTADIAQNKANYDAWGNSHNVSEGGLVADATDYKLTADNVIGMFGKAAPNLKDKVQAGAYMGRIRDMIMGNGETPGLMELAGTEGYNPAVVTGLIAKYNDYLRKAGLNPNDPKWKVGNGVPAAAKAAAGKPAGRERGFMPGKRTPPNRLKPVRHK